MGLFNRLFRSKDTGNNTQNGGLTWIALYNLQQLDEIDAHSMEKPQLIFKHSTTCGISRMVKNRFTQTYDIPAEQADLHYLDLLAYREISNAVAERYGVIHESPQLLVLDKGKVVIHASHGEINDLNLPSLITKKT